MKPVSLADKIASKCGHFNGMQNTCCKAGGSYNGVKDESREAFGRWPCWKEGESVPCANRHFPTDDEVAARVAEHEESFERLTKGFKAVRENAAANGFKKGSGGRGTVKCPNCEGGTLHYMVAGYNGHIWGQCTTEGCTQWMQ